VKGRLLHSFMVDLHPDTVAMGGSWLKTRDPEMMTAYDIDLIQFFYEQMAQIERPVFLDVGANTGSFCLLAQKLSATVIAFEPRRDVAAVLQKNINANNLQLWVTVAEVALSSDDGIAEMKIPIIQSESGLSSLADNPTRYEYHSTEVVQIRSLDRMAIPFDNIGGLHAIKIDTEGHEPFVLQGARDTILRYNPAILMESNADNARAFGYSPSKATDLLASWGYTSFAKVGKEDVWCLR
jgi:FkbM family methyltransferase